MIVGHGIDVVDELRLSRIFNEKLPLIARYYFLPQEYGKQDGLPINYRVLCGKVAIKEAVLKSLGLGLGRGVSFDQVEVSRNLGEAPRISVHGIVKSRALDLGAADFMASLSYCDGKAYASVLAISHLAGNN